MNITLLFNEFHYAFLQVPGQLLGSGTVELAVSYADSRDVLYLRMTDQSAIFAIPGKIYTHTLIFRI